MMRKTLLALLSATAGLAIWPAVSPAAAPNETADAAKVQVFESKIRPLLVNNCYNCHSADTNAKGGLRVDDRNGLLIGGDRGPAVVPGEPAKSRLIEAVSYTNPKLQMPPKKQLSAEEVADLTQWVRDGAAWPGEVIPLANFQKPNARYEQLRKEHWAWKPIHASPVPAVADTAWPKSDVDRFILAKLQSKGLKPVADADRVDLIRRACFDLTGLPPTVQEIDAFLADGSDSAFEKVVDRLLASPAFGERWGRHWLDVARFAESTGPSRNIPYPQAWRYRDYVIDAFNSDKPYNQFIREQIAGDLLPAASPKERDEHLIATGFLAIGPKDVNQRFKVRFEMDNIDEQIDTVSRSMLALTASCARCHDHKFDPIPQADYYALAGIFHSTDDCAGVRNKMGGSGLDYYDTSMLVSLSTTKPPPDPKRVEELKAEYEKAKAEWDAIRGTPQGLAKAPNGQPVQRPYRLRFQRAQAEYLELADPAQRSDVTLGLRDAEVVGDTEIRLRGEAERVGPTVPRGFLSVLSWPDEPKVNPTQSGRLELADWLVSGNNPLTARVIVNRVWEHLFGHGLVQSVDNFGVTGDPPSHPELLDYLAVRFRNEGWSIKRLVRELALTHNYALGAEASPEALAIDPADRLLWRHAPRRLDAEEIRDATLAASGRLDSSRPLASPAGDLKVIEVADNGPQAARFAQLARDSERRSVYLPLLRGWTPTSLQVFDFAEPAMVTGSRDVTTVATQALYALNDPFVRRQSLALAERLLARHDLDDSSRIALAYRTVFGRSANPSEVERVHAFLAAYQDAEQSQAPAEPLNVAEATAQDTETVAAESSGGANANKATDAKAAPPVNPDEVEQVAAPVRQVVVPAPDARTAAWAAFCQTLLGSAEFRYLK
jgi:cytochrome c553